MKDSLTHVYATDPVGQVAIKAGAAGSWFLVGVDWIDAHSGFFVAIGAIVSTGIAAWGAYRNAKRNTSDDNRNL